MKIDNKNIVISNGFVKIARIKEEWYEDVENPEDFIKKIKSANCKVDIFTFWQRIPDVKPKYDYHMEWDSIAAIPVKNYDFWWKKQINSKTRNLIRKAEKKGVEIKLAEFTDDFVKGMTDIFNESPVRQGKPFWHYGKDFDTIKREFSRYLFREDLLGAYYDGKLIGFIMLAYAGNCAITGQIISMIKNRDKSPTNALIAKAVEICENKKIPYLVYAKWDEGTLGNFKRHNGFKKIDLPRYYIPLTIKGEIILKLQLHHGLVEVLPEKAKDRLINLRKKWYSREFTLNT